MVVVFAVTLSASARAQTEPTVAAAGKQTFPMEAPVKFSHLGLEDGLPQLDVQSITQDARGFLWMGTEDGLVRYDGYTMTVFKHDPKDPKSLPGSSVLDLEASKEAVWIATDGGLVKYDIATQRFVRIDQSEVPEPVVALEHDSHGALWVALAAAGVDIYTAGGKGSHRILTDYVVKALASDGHGNMWVGTEGDGALLVTPGGDIKRTVTLEHDGIAGNVIKAIAITKDAVWLGADGGLSRLGSDGGDPETFTPDPTRSTSLSDGVVTELLVNASGQLWVGTEQGLNLFDPEHGTFVQFNTSATNPFSLSNPHVTSIFQDRAGVMWIGTFARGVDKFDHLALAFGFHHTLTFPMGFYEDKGGILWVATQFQGVLAFDRQRQEVTRYTELLVNGQPYDLRALWLMTIARTKDGTVWIGSYAKGLFAFNPKTGAAVHYTADSSELSSDAVFNIQRARGGKLWIGTWGGGLCRLDPKTGTFESWVAGANRGLTSNNIYTIAVDPVHRGVVWLGTGEGGLNRLNVAVKPAQVRTFLHDPKNPNSLGNNAVQSIYQDKAGILWLGTREGLNSLDPATGAVTRYGDEQGMPTAAIYGVLGDKHGRIWMSTNGSGLLTLSPKDGRVTTFTGADGIQANEFAQGSFYKTRKGELMFGGFNGFNWFVPEDIDIDEFAPPAVLTSFEISNHKVDLGKPVSMARTVSLDYQDNVFSFAFSALSFAAPDRVHYKYKLDGFDDDWVETDRNFVTYTNLDGGDYVFRVRAANRHGVWGKDTASIAVHVGVPPWRTWWAYAIYGLILAVIILAYALYQRQKLRAARQELRLAEQQNRITTIENDIALTGAVQTGFLPKANAYASGRFRLLGFYRPADTCSGDWWWYEPHKQSGRHEILVGDVTGHGPGPAMVTAAAATAFRVQNRATQSGVLDRLAVLNEEVLRVGEGKYQMTMSAVEIDDNSGHFVFYSAGGLPVMCLPQQGRAKVVACRGTPLGTEEFLTGQIDGVMEPGSRMMLYTDGLTEITIQPGRLLGMRRLARIFEGTRGLPLDEAAHSIVTQLDAAAAGRPQDDDWTFTLVDWG